MGRVQKEVLQLISKIIIIMIIIIILSVLFLNAIFQIYFYCSFLLFLLFGCWGANLFYYLNNMNTTSCNKDIRDQKEINVRLHFVIFFLFFWVQISSVIDFIIEIKTSNPSNSILLIENCILIPAKYHQVMIIM